MAPGREALPEGRVLDPIHERLAGEDALNEEREFLADHEHDLVGPAQPEPLRFHRRALDVGQRVVRAAVPDDRREPHFQALGECVLGGCRHPLQVRSSDTDRVAVEIVADDLQLAVDDLDVEHGAPVDAHNMADVVADSAAIHRASLGWLAKVVNGAPHLVGRASEISASPDGGNLARRAKLAGEDC